MMNVKKEKALRKAPLSTPTDLSPQATRDIAGALTVLVSDVFALYFKTKNFHWHISARVSAIITCCWTSRPTRFLP